MSPSNSSRSSSATPVNRTVPLPPEPPLSSSPKVSSPLNPQSTPKKAPISLPDPDTISQGPSGSNKSDDELKLGPAMMITSPSSQTSVKLSTKEIFDDDMKSTFRERSRSPSRSGLNQSGTLETTDETALAASWWGEKHVVRPWQDEPKRKRTVPADHAVALEDTRKRVAQAIVSALGTTADIIHEALFLGVEFLEFAPIPGLQPAARTLLDIWDAVQNVDMNRLGCLRLTERCADILISVREEIHEAGDEVGEELAAPVDKLQRAFDHIYRFMAKQTNRPWLKRYLKRDEILRDISGCDTMLRDALSLFGVSIQIRTLKQVQNSERKREQQTQALISALRAAGAANAGVRGGIPIPMSDSIKLILGSDTEITSTDRDPYIVSSAYSSDTVTQFAAANPTLIDTTTSIGKNALGLTDLDVESVTPTNEHPLTSPAPSVESVLPTLATIQDVQNSLDAARDSTDLRQLMRAALQTSSDAEMLEVLQIGRQEMPDAIKTLQRALEKLAERDAAESSGSSMSECPPTSIGLSAKGVVLGKITRRVSLKGPKTTVDKPKRSETIISVETSSSSSGISNSGDGNSSETRRRDTLDREFIESGIDALRRMSRGVETAVPSWTITKYEVDRDEKIGIGFFSDVFKGTWRSRTVAIKVLAESTPRKLFLREIGIWRTLNHPNVLSLYGASSATGDPPWFFVSPYLKNGTLVEHLKRIEMEERPVGLGVGYSATHVMTTSMLQTPRISGWRANTLPGPWSSVNLVGSGSAGPPPRPPGSLTPPLGNGKPLRKSPPREPYASIHSTEIQRSWDLFRFMHEIAKGMEYLHGKGVLHGDLKASNVLVDDKYRCVISDFGQSEMKSEAFRISGTPPPHGTLRWQAPELMSGRSQLTTAVDVWAFSITCVEILTMGRMPWTLMDDSAVRHFVLTDDTRPPLPKHSRFNIPALQEILRASWSTNPDDRPLFSKISRDFKLLRKSYGLEVLESPRLPPIEDVPEHVSSPSPDMRPIDLPKYVQEGYGTLPGSLDSEVTYHTARDASYSSDPEPAAIQHQESTVAAGIKMPEPVIFTPGPSSHGPSSRTSSFVASIHSEDRISIVDYDAGYESPPPMDTRIAEMKNERRYRMLLTHDFHPSLTLPLWDPCPVELGAVGYLSRPRGNFITLFNAFKTQQSDHPGIQGLPNIYGYGNVKTDIQRLPKKTVAQRAIDIFIGSLTFRNASEDIVRRLTFPLKAGHKAAYLYTEVTEYRYMVTLEAAKKWFQSNVDAILRIYGYQHQIQKEDLHLIIGTLSTPEYALLVSHHHPEGHARFNVYANPQVGKPWGTFTTDTTNVFEAGPIYDDLIENPRPVISKISSHPGNGDPYKAVLLARLRFKPDIAEPTSK